MKDGSDNTVRFFVSIIGIVIIALVLRELSNIFIPLVIAYFLFFVFSPLNLFFEKRKVPQILVILLDLTIIIFFLWIASTFLIESFKQFGEQLPAYAEKLNRIISTSAVSMGISDPFLTDFSIEEAISGIDYGPLAGGLFTSTFSFLGTLFFIVFFFVFVVSGHNNIYQALRKRFVNKKINHDQSSDSQSKINIEDIEKEHVAETFKKITSQIQKYLISKFILNLAAGFLGFVVLALLGIDFPIIWGVFIFLFNFIPAIGSAIAVILPVLMSLVQYESTGYALLVFVIIIVLQSVFFSVIEPAIIGKSLNLNPLLILISVLIWGYIWGVVGMLLAVPLTAIIKIVISNSETRNMNFFTDIMSQE